MADVVATVFVCLFLVSLLILVFVVLPFQGLRAAVLWVTGAKDFAELGVRFDKWTTELGVRFDEGTARLQKANVERRERRLEQRCQCGFPPTLRGRLRLEWWRLKKGFAHPVRYLLRGEFRFPPNKHDSSAENLQK